MYKIFIFLSFLIFSTMIFISCSGCNGADGGNDCVVFKSCNTDADCKNEQGYNVCDGGKCQINFCDKINVACGLGKCIPHDNPNTEELDDYYCQCDEGAQFYEYDEIRLCVPKCETDDDCNYKHGMMNYRFCDTNIGNCVFDDPKN